MSAYVYQPAERAESFESAVAVLARRGLRIEMGGIDNASAWHVHRILRKGIEEGLPFIANAVDADAYRGYFGAAGYATKHSGYYVGNQPEKSLEHFVTLGLLGVGRDDVFVDLASEHSPVPDIYRELTGCTAYRQDIMYPAGVNGDRIGGDAAAMPVPDGFFTKAALTCSLEHFEQDADSRLFVELARVLRPGGRVCVAPYYVYTEAAVQTDPVVSAPSSVPFDAGVPVFCARGWNNRHGRFYSPASFRERILSVAQKWFDFQFFHFVNAHEIDPSIYLRFALVATRRA